MIFWIILLVTIVFTIFGFFSDWNSLPSFLGSVLGWFASMVMAFTILVNHIGVNGYIESCNTRYNMLVYQYENGFYNNENEVGKYELIRDIRLWNEDLSKYKELQDDLWVGIFHPNIYDQFEFIELDETN